jgi:hypothetical protein
VLDELIGVLPADQIEEDGRPLAGTDPVLVSLERVESGVIYEGSVELSEGEWAFFPWPTNETFNPEGNPGAPPTQYVTVGDTSPWPWLGLGAAIAAAVGVFTLVLRGRSPVTSE